MIDVSTPTSPIEVGSLDTPGDAQGVAVSGSYAYVADRLAGLRVIDVSVPSSPADMGYDDTPGEAVNVTVAGGYVYVAELDAGMEIFRECGEGVFSDGFESGDTLLWSVSVP